MSKEANISHGEDAAGEGQTEWLGMQKHSGKLPERLGPTQLGGQRAEGSGAREAPDAGHKPKPLRIVLGPGDASWAFLFGLCRFRGPELSAPPSLCHKPSGIRVSFESKWKA